MALALVSLLLRFAFDLWGTVRDLDTSECLALFNRREASDFTSWSGPNQYNQRVMNG